MEVGIKIFYAFLLITVSCKEVQKEKTVYYKRLDKNNKQIGFSIRKYQYSSDTIKEDYKEVDEKGERKAIYHEEYLKINNKLYILSNVLNDNSKYLFFIKEKDTCIDVNRNLDSFIVCNKTSQLNKKNNNYHLIVNYQGYYFKREFLTLDKDFSVIDFIKETEQTYVKEVLIDEKDIDVRLKKKILEGL